MARLESTLPDWWDHKIGCCRTTDTWKNDLHAGGNAKTIVAAIIHIILRVSYQPQAQDDLLHEEENEEERGACGMCVMIIEKVEEEKESGKRRARGNEIVVKVVLIVQVLLCSVVVT